jgi:hypothetical protein
MSVQSMQALKVANEIRIKRAELKREMRALPYAESRYALADLVENPTREVRSAPMMDVLQWPAQTGPRTARKWLMMCRVPATRKLGEVPASQRHLLALCLRGLESVARERVEDVELALEIRHAA